MRKLFLFIRIRFSMETNALLYCLAQWPLLKGLIPDTVYRYKLPKVLLSIFGYTFGLIKDALSGNLAFLLTAYLIPRQLMQWSGQGEGIHPLLFAFFSVTVFSILPALVRSDLLAGSRDDVLFLNHFMMDPRDWYRHKYIKLLWRQGFLILPSFFLVFGDPLMVTSLLAIQLASIAGGNYLYVTLYSREIKIPSYRMRQLLALSMSLLLYGMAYAWPLPKLVMSPWFWMGTTLFSLLLCGVFSTLLLRSGNLRELAVGFAVPNDPTADPSAVSLEFESRRLDGSGGDFYEKQFQKYKKLDAWGYFDRILRLRLLGDFRSKRIQNLVVNIIFPLIVGLLFRYQAFGFETSNLLQFSPIMLTVVISKVYGPSYFDLCFRHMDAPLLYHRFYDDKTIRLSLRRRFSFLMRNGLFLLGTSILDLVIFLLAAGSWMPTGLLLKIVLVFALLLFIFESLHLVLYYLLQPYSMDQTLKNPILTVLKLIQTLFIYAFLFMRWDISSLLLPLFLVSLLVIGVLFLAFRLAPRTFKIRA